MYLLYYYIYLLYLGKAVCIVDGVHHKPTTKAHCGSDTAHLLAAPGRLGVQDTHDQRGRESLVRYNAIHKEAAVHFLHHIKHFIEKPPISPKLETLPRSSSFNHMTPGFQLNMCRRRERETSLSCQALGYSCLHTFISIYLSIYPSVRPSIHTYLYLSISINIYLNLSISIYINLAIYLSISFYLYLSLSISIYIYLCLSMSIYIYLYLSISIY